MRRSNSCQDNSFNFAILPIMETLKGRYHGIKKCAISVDTFLYALSNLPNLSHQLLLLQTQASPSSVRQQSSRNKIKRGGMIQAEYLVCNQKVSRWLFAPRWTMSEFSHSFIHWPSLHNHLHLVSGWFPLLITCSSLLSHSSRRMGLDETCKN